MRRPAYFLSHPDHIAHVLQTHHWNYREDELGEPLKPFLGTGLATSDGDLWGRQRRLMQPAFHRPHMAIFTTIVTATTADLLDRWCPLAAGSAPVDLLPEMMRLTGSIIVNAPFGTTLCDPAGTCSAISGW
jgi:cytochrome P450